MSPPNRPRRPRRPLEPDAPALRPAPAQPPDAGGPRWTVAPRKSGAYGLFRDGHLIALGPQPLMDGLCRRLNEGGSPEEL